MQRMKGNLFFAFFFSKSVFEGTQADPVALSVVIFVPDLSFHGSRVLGYANIRFVL